MAYLEILNRSAAWLCPDTIISNHKVDSDTTIATAESEYSRSPQRHGVRNHKSSLEIGII